ncbi:MAG: CADD family putative folate metabolism protein [Ignavibacteria bacterium]
MLTKEKFSESIINTIKEKSILKHPFYQKWNEGKLTLEELQVYAKQYYHFIEHFPMFVSAVHSNCSNPEARLMLTENLADEEGFKTGTADHPSLWINFCGSLGLREEDVIKTEPKQEVKNMADGFYNLCRSSDYRVGLSALLAYEYQIPEVSKVKIDGLKKFYGIQTDKEIEFFTVHRTADINHSKAELDILLKECKSDSEQQEVLSVINKAAGLYWNMLDGVYVN